MNCPYKKITTELTKERLIDNLKTVITTENFHECDGVKCMAYSEIDFLSVTVKKCKLMEQ